jgi:hypothetical protein
MTEPQSADHWASLAGDLGAEPAPEKSQATPVDSETSQEQSLAAPPPVFQPAAKVAKPSRRPAQPAAWEQLAGDLGIAPPPSAAPTTPEAIESCSPFPPPISAENEGGMQPAQLAAEIEAELTAWDDIDPTATEPRAFEPQEALDVMDETADEFDVEFSGESAAPSGEAAPQEREERRGRRRRRRGRARNRETAESAESPLAEPDRGQAAGGFGDGLELESPETPEGETSEYDRGERRSRGRRRGRGADRVGRAEGDRHREESFAAEDDFGAEAAEGFSEREEDEAIHAGAEASGDFELDEEIDDGGESPRIGFRNIPTWHDAIGAIIGKNMESRARNPSGSRGHGGRGGRGRGRGRDRRPDRR